MNDLMYKMISSDIRLLELKLKKIRFRIMILKFQRPMFFEKKALRIWKDEMSLLKNDEDNILKSLQTIYNEIADKID